MKVWKQKEIGFYFIQDFWGRSYIGYDTTTDLDKVFPYAKLQEGIVEKTNKQLFQEYIGKHGWMIIQVKWNTKIDKEKFEPHKQDLAMTIFIKHQTKIARDNFSKAKKKRAQIELAMKNKRTEIENLTNQLKIARPDAVNEDYKVVVD